MQIIVNGITLDNLSVATIFMSILSLGISIVSAIISGK